MNNALRVATTAKKGMSKNPKWFVPVLMLQSHIERVFSRVVKIAQPMNSAVVRYSIDSLPTPAEFRYCAILTTRPRTLSICDLSIIVL